MSHLSSTISGRCAQDGAPSFEERPIHRGPCVCTAKNAPHPLSCAGGSPTVSTQAARGAGRLPRVRAESAQIGGDFAETCRSSPRHRRSRIRIHSLRNGGSPLMSEVVSEIQTAERRGRWRPPSCANSCGWQESPFPILGAEWWVRRPVGLVGGGRDRPISLEPPPTAR